MTGRRFAGVAEGDAWRTVRSPARRGHGARRPPRPAAGRQADRRRRGATGPATPRRRPRSRSWRCRWRRRSASAGCSSAGRGSPRSPSPPSRRTCWPSSAAAAASAWRCRRSRRVVGLALFTSLAFYRGLERLRPADPRDLARDDRRPGLGLARLRHRHRPGRAPHRLRGGRRASPSGCRRSWPTASASAPAPGRRCWWRRASCSCSARPWPASGSACCRRRCGSACAALAFVLHRSMLQEDGSGWLTTHRRGTITAAARVGATLGLSAIVLALGRRARCCPGASDDAAHQHPQPPLGLAPDDQPAGRHPGPHRQPERHRALHGARPRRRRTGGSPRSTSSTAGSGRRPAPTATPPATLGGGLTNGHTTPLEQQYTINGLVVDLVPGGVRADTDLDRRRRPLRRRDVQHRHQVGRHRRGPAVHGRVARSRTSPRTSCRRDRRRRRPTSPPTTPSCPPTSRPT